MHYSLVFFDILSAFHIALHDNISFQKYKLRVWSAARRSEIGEVFKDANNGELNVTAGNHDMVHSRVMASPHGGGSQSILEGVAAFAGRPQSGPRS